MSVAYYEVFIEDGIRFSIIEPVPGHISNVSNYLKKMYPAMYKVGEASAADIREYLEDNRSNHS